MAVIHSVFALLLFTAAAVTAVPLRKEVVNLPPLIHFSDIFNTQNEKSDEPFTPLTGNIFNPSTSPPQTTYPYPPNTGYPGYPQTGYPQNPYPSTPYPYPPTEYPPIGYPTYPIGYPPLPPSTNYPQYPQYPPLPSYPQYPPYPPNYPYYPFRQQNVEIAERYWKFNDDGSKEYKVVMSNGLSIYQKILTKAGDTGNIQFIEGYYSDKRDDHTFLNTYFSATDRGYSASAEISNSAPSYPDVKEMMSFPPTLSHRKTKV